MSQQVVIESINNPGELANIIFTPFGLDISINLGNVTLPYLFEPGLLDPPRDIYGNYTITTLEDSCVHYLEVLPSTPTVTNTPTITPTITPTLSLSKSLDPTPTESICATRTPKTTSTVTPTFYSTPTNTGGLQVTPTLTKTLTPTAYGIVFSGSEECDVIIEISDGIRGYYIYDIDLTSDTGVVNFEFNAFTIPDRFVIEYPVGNIIYDSGFRGNPLYNQDLADNGFPPVTGSGIGSGFFNKPLASPSEAKLIVFAPLTNTKWRFLMECPTPFVTSTSPATTPITTPSPTNYGIVFSGGEECNVVINISAGTRGYYIYILDLTSDTGIVNFNFNAFQIPDRFIIEYPIGTQIYDSGFRGLPFYNQDLADNGFPPVTGTGIGSGFFVKNNPLPDQAKLIVFAPLTNTKWRFLMECPTPFATSTSPATTPVTTPSPTPYGIVVSGSEVCNNVISINDGARGYYVYILDLTSDTGVVNFNFNAFQIPDRFVIEYPIGNQIYDSGFRGLPFYNQDLIDNGFPPVTGTGIGSGFFIKNNPLPDQAKLIVFAPLTLTKWTFLMECPTPFATSTSPSTTPVTTPSPTAYGIVVSGSEVCNVVINIDSGARGYYVYILDLTSDTGRVNFNFNAFQIPDRFIIEYPIGTQIYDSGFRGLPFYNADLIASGFPPVTGTGIGSGFFIKNNPLPDQAKLIVFAPLPDTKWQFLMECPTPFTTATSPATTPVVTPSPTAYGIVVSGSEVCNVVIDIRNQSRGYFTFILELTSDVGQVNFRYSAYTIPDRFIIEYPIGNQIFDSGFRGDPFYNQQLNDNGFPPVTGSGFGNGFFIKNNPLPDQGRLVVFAPLDNTAWSFIVDCPVPIPTATPPSTTKTTPTVTPTKTLTPTYTKTLTVTKTSTVSPTITKTSTVTPTITPTINPTPSITRTNRVTPTVTRTPKSTGLPLPPAPSPTKTKTPTITSTITPTPSITPLGYFGGEEDCGPGLQVNGGGRGVYTYEVDIGTVIGFVEFQFQAFSVPDRFILEWPGTVVGGPPGTIVADSGFRGNPSYNNDLANYFEPTWCNPGCSPATPGGSGTIGFDKTAALPDKMTLYVVAPLDGTRWDFGVGCPDPGPIPSETPLPTPTITITKTITKTITQTITITKTLTPTKQNTPTPTVTKTVTKTPTPTKGLTPTPTPSQFCTECCPVLYIANEKVYLYDVATNTSTPLNVTNITGYGTDIAHTKKKLWLAGPNGIREWDITLSPFSSALSKTIPFPFEFGAGLAAINDTTLLASPQRDGNPCKIIRIDLSTTPITITDLIILPSNICFVGDIMVTITNKIIFTAVDTNLNRTYIYQYNFTGNQEFETQLNLGFQTNASSLFQADGDVFIGNFNNGAIYRIQTNQPYFVTFYNNTGNNSLAGASSLLECNPDVFQGNVTPTPTITVTKTFRRTPTPTKTMFPTPTVTKTPQPTPNPTKTPTKTKAPDLSPQVSPTITRTPNSTPNPTKTVTPTLTLTKTVTPTVGSLVSECSVILNSTSPASAYTYGLGSGVINSIYLPDILASQDIAHIWDPISSTGYVWMYNNALGVIRQWEITSLNPFTINPVYTDISYGVGVASLGNGMGCINSTTLLSSIGGNPAQIIEIDISTSPFTYTTLITLPDDYIVAGDILFTTTGKLIITVRKFTAPQRSWIYQYDYPSMTNLIDIEITTTIPTPLGIFQDSGNFYVASSFGEIYQVGLSSPYPLTLVDTLPSSLNGASQSPQCITSEFTSAPAPSPTRTQTLTPTNLDCKCYRFTITSGLGLAEYTNCLGQSFSTIVTPTTPFEDCVGNGQYQVLSGVIATLKGQCVSNSCPGPTPTPSATVTLTPTKTQTNTITPTKTPTNTITPTKTPTNTVTPTMTSEPVLPVVSACEPIFMNGSTSGIPGVYLSDGSIITPPVAFLPNAADIAHTWDSLTSIGYIHIAYNSIKVIREWKITSLTPLTYDTNYNGGLGYRDISYPSGINTLGNGMCHVDNTGTKLLTSTPNSSTPTTMNIIEITISAPPINISFSTLKVSIPSSNITGDLMVTTNNKFIFTRTEIPSQNKFVEQYNYSNNNPEQQLQYSSISLIGLWEESGNIYGVDINSGKYLLPSGVGVGWVPVFDSTLPIPGGLLNGSSQIPPCINDYFVSS